MKRSSETTTLQAVLASYCNRPVAREVRTPRNPQATLEIPAELLQTLRITGAPEKTTAR